MAVASYIVVGAFVAWFAVSVAAQLSRDLIWPLKSNDVFALIPSWTFFAPNPGTRDYQVLYRDQLDGGELTPWHQLHFAEASPARVLWNPDKRRRKAIVDMCSFLMRMVSRDKDDRGVFVSIPYLGLLMHVSQLERSPISVSTQFMIAQTFGYHDDREPEILFISHLHPL